MKTRLIQSNMTAGALAPTLKGRIDINKYYNGLAEAENVVILPHGGVRRRPGLEKVEDSYVGVDSRIEAFVFSSTQSYLILFSPSIVKIYKDGVLQATLTSPYATIEVIRDIDLVQSADTMILVHEDYAPMQLQRQGSDIAWALSLIDFDFIPKFNWDNISPKHVNTGATQTVTISPNDIIYNNDNNDVDGADYTYYKFTSFVAQTLDLSTIDYSISSGFPSYQVIGSQTDAWSATRGWPRTVTFHQGRLWFAGSRDKVSSMWGSVVNDFFNFKSLSAQPDEAIFDTLNTDQYNAINGIFSGRHLQVFTTGGEFYNSSKLITPSDSSWLKQTSYGAIKERPISIDGATLYIDRSGRNLRQFSWSFNEDSYVSINASLISSHIVKTVRSIATIKGTSNDLSDFVYVVNTDGTVAVMNSMRHEEIRGFTQWTTQGTFEDVAVVDKETYFLVKRNSEVFIERVAEGTYTDHNVKIEGILPETYNITYGVDNIVFDGDNIVFTNSALGTPVTSVTTNYKDVLLDNTFKVIADNSMQDDATFTIDGTDLNHVDITRDAYSLEVGLNYDVVVKTLPLNVDSSENGPIVNLRKRVNRVILNLYESLGVFVMQNYLSDRQFTVVLDDAPVPFTGIHEIYLFGYTDRLVEVTVTQQNPLPFVLLGIDSEIEH